MIFEDLDGFRVPIWIFDRETIKAAIKFGMLQIVDGHLEANKYADPNQTYPRDKTNSILDNNIKELKNIASNPNVYEDEKEITHSLREVGSNAFTPDEVLKRRYRKKVLMDIRGGKCENCGYSENFAALDFHHPNKKNFAISLALTEFTDRQFEEILIPEVKHKTILLCANCHREEHHEKCII